jgi:hypothetical protein
VPGVHRLLTVYGVRSLLNRVGQFMCQQLLPYARLKVGLTFAQIYIGSMHGRLRAHGASQLRGLAARVQAHPAEVGPKARLHKIACAGGQRAAAAVGADIPHPRPNSRYFLAFFVSINFNLN